MKSEASSVISSMVGDFTNKLVEFISEVIADSVNAPEKRGPGRPPKVAAAPAKRGPGRPKKAGRPKKVAPVATATGKPRGRKPSPEVAERVESVKKYLEDAKGEYVTGAQIAKDLKISRALVSQYINKLRADKVDVKAKTRRGYKIGGSDTAAASAPKKRGRKPKVAAAGETAEAVAPKKRGRKPKAATNGANDGPKIVLGSAEKKEDKADAKEGNGKRAYTKWSKEVVVEKLQEHQKAGIDMAHSKLKEHDPKLFRAAEKYYKSYERAIKAAKIG